MVWGFCFKEEEEILLVGNKEEKEEELEMKKRNSTKIYAFFYFTQYNKFSDTFFSLKP